MKFLHNWQENFYVPVTLPVIGYQWSVISETDYRLLITDYLCCPKILGSGLSRLGVYEEIFPIVVTYMISNPDVEEYAKEKGIALYYSYDF